MPCPPAAATKVSHAFLDALPAPARDALLAAAVERRYAADETIFLAGTRVRGMYLVLDGHVRVVRGAAGRAHVVHDEGPGGALGEVPLFEGATYPATAVAATPTRCLFLSRAAVHAAVRAHPNVALALLARLAARVRLLVERMDERTARPALGRLAALLLDRHRASRGAPFTLGRSQQDAAEELGTVREVVVRGLKELRERGVVRAAGRGTYVVVDAGALGRLSRRQT